MTGSPGGRLSGRAPGPLSGPVTGPAELPPQAAVPSPDAAVFVISVAAELTGMHPQTLRTYDRLGLVSPGRTLGGGRRYSWRDIQQLREVAELTAAGIGLEGVRRILDLEGHVEALMSRVRDLEEALAAAEYALRRSRDQGSARNLPAVPSPARSVVVWRRGS